MTTVRFKGTVVGNGPVTEGIVSPSSPTLITIQGAPTLGGQQSPQGLDTFLTNVAGAISALAINGSVSVYMTTLAGDKTAIEAAVTVVAASSQD